MWHKTLTWLTRQFIGYQRRRQPRRPLAELQADRIKRVLLINSTALGDLLFSTPAIRGLRQRYPAWELDLLVQPAVQALVRHDPQLARVYTFPGRSWRLLALVRELRSRRYDLAIILHGNDPEMSLLAWLSGAPFLIGSGKSPLSFAYSDSVGPGGQYEHAIERRLNFVRPLGVEVADKRMAVFLPAGVAERAADILAREWGDSPAPLVALHPGGSDAYKRWPLANFAALGNFLAQVYQARLLIISSAGELSLARSLAEQLAAPSLVTGGRFDLLTVAGLLSRCQLFVGNDSGPLHLALACGTPSLGLFGADDPRRVGPYQVPWGASIFKPEACPRSPCITRRCPQPHCLAAIDPGEVMRLIRTWWEPAYLPHLTQRVTHGGKSA